MATSDGILRGDLQVVFHDPFTKADYAAICVREGRAFTEEGYEQWRDTCERLSGDMSTERRIAKLGAALQDSFSALGVTAAQASTALGALGVALSQPGLAKKENR
jgi:hypothetical protein